MRISWRTYLMILLFGLWPHLGCHQLPADKSVQDLRPIQQNAGDSSKKQELTAADIMQDWLAKADKLEKEGKAGEAIALCERQRGPGNPQALQATRKIAAIRDRGDDLDGAEKEYRTILEKNPRDADALVNLGYVCYRRNQLDLAEKYLSAGLKQNPNHPYGWVNLGHTLAKQGGRESEAVEAFAKVTANKAEAYCEVAFWLNRQGRVPAAIAAYEQALKIDATFQRARTELANIQQSQGSTVYTTPYRPTAASKVSWDGMNGAGIPESAVTLPPTREGAGQQMNQRPVVAPLLDFDVDSQTTSKNK